MSLRLAPILAVPLSVAQISVASAAFSFSLNPNPSFGGIGTTVAVDLVATNTSASPNDLSFFTVTLNPGAGSDPDITLVNPTITYGPSIPFFGTALASGASGTIGTFTEDIGPSASVFDTGIFTGTVVALDTLNEFSIQGIQLRTTAIPEPGALGLLAVGGLGVVATRRRRS